MTPNDTKPEKAEASAVEVLPTRDECARMVDPGAFNEENDPYWAGAVGSNKRLERAYKTADRLLAYPWTNTALQSSSSAEAELREWMKHVAEVNAHALRCQERATAAEAERDTALTAITDARQALTEAGISMPFLDDGVKALAAERDALRDRVKVLEEALWAIRAKMREEVEVVDDEDGPCSVFLDDDVVLRDIDNLLSAALNHSIGEDAPAAGQQIAKEAEGSA